MRAEFIAAVLGVADLIPTGKVLAYGDIAVLLENGGPRQIGSVISHYGSAIPWWRIIRASGQPPQCHSGQALTKYLLEETPLRGQTTGENPRWRIDITKARWSPSEEEFVAIEAIATRLAEAAHSEANTGSNLSEPHDVVAT